MCTGPRLDHTVNYYVSNHWIMAQRTMPRNTVDLVWTFRPFENSPYTNRCSNPDMDEARVKQSSALSQKRGRTYCQWSNHVRQKESCGRTPLDFLYYVRDNITKMQYLLSCLEGICDSVLRRTGRLLIQR